MQVKIDNTNLYMQINVESEVMLIPIIFFERRGKSKLQKTYLQL